jgi:hypothetical protein
MGLLTKPRSKRKGDDGCAHFPSSSATLLAVRIITVVIMSLVSAGCGCRVARLPDGSTMTSCNGRDVEAAARHQASIDFACPREQVRWHSGGGITSDLRPIMGMKGCGKLAYYTCREDEPDARFDPFIREVRYECRATRER